MAQLYALGVPITVANGDNSVTDNTGAPMADFPSSSPYALAAGGTTLKIVDVHPVYEWVWNNGAAGGATGGAISTLFPPNTFVGYQSNGKTWDVGFTSSRLGLTTNGRTYTAFTARSYHPGGVNALMMDGSVRFMKNSVNRDIWRGLGSRNGGEVISADAY
jgi:prepilin-type processing-associated H-X9-DG protein